MNIDYRLQKHRAKYKTRARIFLLIYYSTYAADYTDSNYTYSMYL